MRRQSQHQKYEPVGTEKRGQQLLNNYSFFTPTAVTIGGNPIKYSGVRFRQKIQATSHESPLKRFFQLTHTFSNGERTATTATLPTLLDSLQTKKKRKAKRKTKKKTNNNNNIIIIQYGTTTITERKQIFQKKASSMLVTPSQEYIHHINGFTTREPWRTTEAGWIQATLQNRTGKLQHQAETCCHSADANTTRIDSTGHSEQRSAGKASAKTRMSPTCLKTTSSRTPRTASSTATMPFYTSHFRKGSATQMWQ